MDSDTYSKRSLTATSGTCGQVLKYAAFFFVGTACGYFPMDAILNLAVNEGLGSQYVGQLFVCGGIVGILSAALYLIYSVTCSDKQSLKKDQYLTTLLIIFTILLLLLLAAFWKVDPPTYPIVMISYTLGGVVVSCTYLVVLPMIAANYGGWVVAPVRAGTDFSTMLTNLLGELQDPSGSKLTMPSWVLFLVFAVFPSIGLLAWTCLKPVANRFSDNESKTDSHADATEVNDCVLPEEIEEIEAGQLEVPFRACLSLRNMFFDLACHRSLIGLVLLGFLVDAMQWGVIASFSYVGAQMTDPSGCDGARGSWVNRTATTVNRISIPFASVLSSCIHCPRSAMYVLGLLQLTAACLMLFAVGGVGRDLVWTTDVGQITYIVCYGLVGFLEGYVLTSAYRLIGDAQGVPLHVRKHACHLLGLLILLGVSAVDLVTGALASSGVVSCRP